MTDMISLLLSLSSAAPYIVLGNRVVIHQMQLDGTERKQLPIETPTGQDIRGIDFDFRFARYRASITKLHAERASSKSRHFAVDICFLFKKFTQFCVVIEST